MRILKCFSAKRGFALLGLSLLPILSHAHPGHEGIPVHTFADILLVVAGYYSLKRLITFGVAVAGRRKIAA